jgi:hypothetical protein
VPVGDEYSNIMQYFAVDPLRAFFWIAQAICLQSFMEMGYVQGLATWLLITLPILIFFACKVVPFADYTNDDLQLVDAIERITK